MPRGAQAGTGSPAPATRPPAQRRCLSFLPRRHVAGESGDAVSLFNVAFLSLFSHQDVPQIAPSLGVCVVIGRGPEAVWRSPPRAAGAPGMRCERGCCFPPRPRCCRGGSPRRSRSCPLRRVCLRLAPNSFSFFFFFLSFLIKFTF